MVTGDSDFLFLSPTLFTTTIPNFSPPFFPLVCEKKLQEN